MTVADRAGPWTAPASDGPVAAPLVQAEVAAFLAFESEAIDQRRFEDWIAMVDDGFVYRVPVPVLRDNAFDPPYDPGSLLIDEDKASIVELWFGRFAEGIYEVAWGDHPPVRSRHFVTNVRARLTGRDDELDVRSNVRLHMIRQGAHRGELVAERFDRLRRTPDGLRLASRFAVLDDLVLDAPQLRVML